MHRKSFSKKVCQTHGLVLALVSLLLIPAVRADPALPTGANMPDNAQKAYVASQLYTAVRIYFAHWMSVPTYDLDRAYRQFLGEVYRTENRYDFDLAAIAFLASLGNGHTGFYDEWLFTVHGQPTGFRCRWLEAEKGWVVESSSVAGVESGDVLAAIDGLPIEEFYALNRKYVTASNERYRRHLMFRNGYSFLLPHRFMLKLSSGRSVEVERNPGPSSAPMQTEGRWLQERQVAYVRIPTFSDEKFERRAIELVQEFSAAKALVIDVRGNGGGNTPGNLLATLMDRPYRSWTESTPITAGLFDYYREQYERADKTGWSDFQRGYLQNSADYFYRPQLMWQPMFTPPVAGAYRGQVFLLVDSGCFSACEDFLVPFKDNRRATLVGEASGGSTGQPYLHDFGNGMSFRVSTKREYFPDGSPFEGIGILPDVSVELTAQDLATRKDAVLAKVLGLL